MNPKTNETLGPHKEGELLVKSSAITSNHHGSGSSSRLEEEEWFKTGYIMMYDENCFFYYIRNISSDGQLLGTNEKNTAGM